MEQVLLLFGILTEHESWREFLLSNGADGSGVERSLSWAETFDLLMGLWLLFEVLCVWLWGGVGVPLLLFLFSRWLLIRGVAVKLSITHQLRFPPPLFLLNTLILNNLNRIFLPFPSNKVLYSFNQLNPSFNQIIQQVLLLYENLNGKIIRVELLDE